MRPRSFSTKKAKADAAGAAVLVVLIALLIILYVLFLPPDERAALLGNPDMPGQGGSPGTPGAGGAPYQVIFSTIPTIPEYTGPDVKELAPFTVRTLTAGNLLAERSGLSIERSVFHSDEEVMTFTVPPSTSNALLSFDTAVASGNLRIDLNGERIFDAPITQRQPPPVVLTSRLAQSNELRFSVSSVGFQFWRTNGYELSNVRVTGDVTSFEDAEQMQRFVLTDFDDIKEVQLLFYVECFEQKGRLTIELNDQSIYSGKPECDFPIALDLAPQRLTEGENTLVWSVDNGRYLIDQVEIVSEHEYGVQEESFSISQELLSRAVAENREVLLELSFVRPGAEGMVLLNGQELAFRTHKQSFAGPITTRLTPGTNTIQLVDSSTDVTALRVLYG